MYLFQEIDSFQEYLERFMELQAPDKTRFGDGVPGSRYRRSFCGHCGQPMRVKLSKKFRSLRKCLDEFSDKEKQWKEKGMRGKMPVFPERTIVYVFTLRNMCCKDCSFSTFFYRRSARRPSHVCKKMESIVEEDSNGQ